MKRNEEMTQNSGLTNFEIRDETNRCQKRFEECFAHPKLRKQQWLEDGAAEFNGWSLCLDASHSGRSSLDYKVRQRPDLRVIITDLLGGLGDFLEICLEPDLLAEIDGTAGVFSLEKNIDSPLHIIVSNIKDTLKDLTRIQNMIRKLGTRLRHHKADMSLKSMLEQNVNGLQEFRRDMIKSILSGLEHWNRSEGLPKPWENADMKLIERFVDANVKRRNRIFFATEKMRRKRALQLKERQESTVVVDLEEEVAKTAIEPRPHAGEEAERMSKAAESAKEPPADPLTWRGSLNEESQASTAATTIPLNAIIEQAPSNVAGTAITKATGTTRGQAYPLPPKWPEGCIVPHINCPYCSEPLTKEHIKQAAWRGHVSGDILPYMCFIEDCKSPDDLYRTSEELTKHVISDHGVPCWLCDECTPDTEQGQFEIFETAQLWIEHQRHTHKQTMLEVEFPKLAELSMHKMVPPIKCPLCDYSTSEIKPSIDPEILRHLHQFSIRSLPWEALSEGNLSVDHLKRNSSSASTGSSSNNRTWNVESFEDIPDPNHEEMQLKDRDSQSMCLELLKQISARLVIRFTSVISGTAPVSFLEEMAQNLDHSSSEILLPTLVQLQCSMEERVAFGRHGNEWDEGQEHSPSLGPELIENFHENLNQMVNVLAQVHTGVKERRSLNMTKCGTNEHINQWRDLIGLHFIPGDPDYVPRGEDEEALLTLQERI